MSAFDEMRNDIESLYGASACECHVYSDMVDYIDESETDYESLKKENDRLIKEIDRLVMNSSPTAAELRRVRAEWKKDRAQNAKLRDIVRMYVEYTSQDRCEGCVCKRACNEGMVEECWQLTEIRKAEKAARELGIEI